MNETKLLAAGLIAATLIPVTAFAHHSASMFEPTKEQIIVGTVTKFEWTSPHAWIELDVPDVNGTITHWSIECVAPVGLAREGWTHASVRPGDKISVVMHPMRNGEHGGSLMGVVTAGGKQLGAPLHPPGTKAAQGSA